MQLLRELWQYREMIISLVGRDLKGRYKQSILGFLWMFVNPLLQMCIYSIVFSIIMRIDIEKYYLYLFVGLVPWIFFNTALTGGAMVVIGEQDMLKKIYFPREVLPIANTLSQFVNMALSILVIIVIALCSGVRPSALALLTLPLVMVLEYALALGVEFLTSSLNVYFRDLEHILAIVSMAWMYLTPIVYSEEHVPERYRGLLNFNPLTSIIKAYRDILYYGQTPNAGTLCTAAVWAVIVLLCGGLVFAYLQRGFAEEL